MERKIVKIINPVQAGFYYKNGLKPLERIVGYGSSIKMQAIHYILNG